MAEPTAIQGDQIKRNPQEINRLSPARGCNCEGSAKEGPVRKEDTSWASWGSKGVGENVLVGGAVESETVVDGEDLRPVNLSQIDILRLGRDTEGWAE